MTQKILCRANRRATQKKIQTLTTHHFNGRSWRHYDKIHHNHLTNTTTRNKKKYRLSHFRAFLFSCTCISQFIKSQKRKRLQPRLRLVPRARRPCPAVSAIHRQDNPTRYRHRDVASGNAWCRIKIPSTVAVWRQKKMDNSNPRRNKTPIASAQPAPYDIDLIGGFQRRVAPHCVALPGCRSALISCLHPPCAVDAASKRPSSNTATTHPQPSPRLASRSRSVSAFQRDAQIQSDRKFNKKNSCLRLCFLVR